MAKNLIPEIAKMLGVELGEAFKVKDEDALTYRFTDDGLKVIYDGGIEISNISTNSAFVALVEGQDEIVKLPWKPTLNKGYWTFTVRDFLESSPRTWTIRPGIWENHPIDIALLNKGWVYRTRAEAETALPAVTAEIGVEYKL